MKNIDVIIFYEHVNREYESVNELKKTLSLKGVTSIIIPVHYNKYINLFFWKPKLILMPFLYDKNIDLHLMYEKLYGKIKVVNLASEQILDSQTILSHLPKDSYSINATHCAWSTKYKDSLLNVGVKNEDIWLIGNPRIDAGLLINPKRKMKYILIPTSFARTFISDSYINKIRVDKNIYLRRVEHAKKARDNFFKLVYKLSKIFDNEIYVLRPHPNVNIENYLKSFLIINSIDKLPINIKINPSGSIYSALSTAKLVISWFSTTIVESYLFGVKHVVYDPLDDRSYSSNDLFQFYPINKENELINILKNKDFCFKENNKVQEYISENIGIVDKKSILRLASNLSQSIKNIDNKNEIKLYFLLKIFCNILIIDFPKNIFKYFRILHIISPFYNGLLLDDKSNTQNFKREK